MAFLKTITIDGFYTKEQAIELSNVVGSLQYKEFEFGCEIENFNPVPVDIDNTFSAVLGRTVVVDIDNSGIFRLPEHFVHFEGFDSTDEWLFVVALENSTFNLYEHKSGAKSALDGYQFNYRNLFEWDLTVNYLLEPGQGIFFRPWLFHTFDMGLIQLFKLKEI
jgi:hypothetical protein